MSDHVLVGPFLTRAQAARLAGLSREDTRIRPDLLRLGGRWLEETYFAFQFDRAGIQPNIARAVELLKGMADDEAVADWLVTPNRHLQRSAPLRLLRSGGNHDRIVVAARADFLGGPMGSPPHVTADVPVDLGDRRRQAAPSRHKQAA